MSTRKILFRTVCAPPSFRTSSARARALEFHHHAGALAAQKQWVDTQNASVTVNEKNFVRRVGDTSSETHLSTCRRLLRMGFKSELVAEATEYHGRDEGSRAAMLARIAGRVVAVDTAGWMYEARSSPRCAVPFGGRSYAAHFRSWRRSTVELVLGRCVQLIKHGAHPVIVLEGADSKARRTPTSDWKGIEDAVL
jgi:hypothetical protein